MTDIADIKPDESKAGVVRREFTAEDRHDPGVTPEQSDSKLAPDLVQQIEQERMRLRMLQELSIALTSATETDQAALAILELAFTALGANAGSVALLSGDGAELHTIRSLGYLPELTDQYRRYSIDALLPTADVVRSGTGLFIETLQQRDRLYPGLKDSVIQGGRGAAVVLPIMAHAKVQGALQLNFASDRHFPEHERTFLVTLVHLCALAVERIRSEQSDRQARDQFETFMSEQERDRRALRESEERFSVLFNESQDALGVAANGCILYVNAAYAEMLGYESPGELVGLPTMDVVAPDDRTRLEDMARSRHAGESLPRRYVFRARRKDGTEIDIENRVSFIQQEGQKLTLVISRDVTARNKRLRAERFLAQATALLASSLDYETTLRNLAKLVVPHLADWCVIHLTDSSGALQQVAVSHVDPQKTTHAEQMGHRYPPDPQSPTGIYNVLRTGKSEAMNDIPEAIIRAVARSDEHLRVLLELGMKSYLCVPLTARDHRLGTITFLGAESGHRYGSEDVALAEDLARHAARAVEHARLYRAAQKEVEERRRAEEQIVARQTEVVGLNARLSQAMTETHHRVKNNLQVIAAMIDISLGERNGDIPRSEFERLNLHVRTLAALHDLLTHRARQDATATVVSALRVLEKVISMNRTGAMSRTLHLRAQDAPLPVRHATGLALVLSELLTNSIKYGEGDIAAEFVVGPIGRLVVSDSGPGFPEGFDASAARSTGLELVDTIVRWDLGGQMRFQNRGEGGAEVEVTFPWPEEDA